MWSLLDFLLSLLMLLGVGGGAVWAAYAIPRGLVVQSVAAGVVALGSLLLWVGLEDRGRTSRANRKCPACGQRLRLDRGKSVSVGPASGECRWCGGSFVWRASRSRFGVGHWHVVSKPKRTTRPTTPR